MSRANLLGLQPSELEDLAVSLDASRYRGRQLATWIYRKGVFDLDAMTDLPRDFRARLAETHEIVVPEVERATPSQDGSRKLVFRLADDRRVSAVLMPDDGRITLCLSTQVGCGFACTFCLTGTMGLDRNLDTSEIVGQLLAANALLEGEERVTHLVFMGMGEPLANYANLVAALRILTDQRLGLGYSPRRITVSTVGLVAGIDRLGREDLRVNLAISLHAAPMSSPLLQRTVVVRPASIRIAWKARMRASGGRRKSAPSQSLNGIRFTLARIPCSSRTRRRASSGLSLTFSSITYSKNTR